MFKKIMANATMKKSFIFAMAFALTGILMGGVLVGITDSNEAVVGTMSIFSTQEDSDLEGVWRPQSEGRYSDFAMKVRIANGTDTGETAVPLDFTFLNGAAAKVPSIFSTMKFYHVEDEAETEPGGQAGFIYLPNLPLRRDLQEFTYNRCQEIELEYELVLAVMWRESRFQEDAVGYNSNGTQDSGLMQINDINREWLKQQYGITDLMDPCQNIEAGTAMLADYMREYGDEKAALMAYHLGEAGMQRSFAQGVTSNSQITTALDMRDSYRQMIQDA